MPDTPQTVTVRQGLNGVGLILAALAVLALVLFAWWLQDEWTAGQQAIRDVEQYRAAETARAEAEAKEAEARKETQGDLENIVEERGARRRESAATFEPIRRRAESAEARDPDRARATSRVGADFVGVWNLAARRGAPPPGTAAADPGGTEARMPDRTPDPDR